MKEKYDKQFLDTMSRAPENWKGPFYYNRKDPRLIVSKLHPSLGWTLNFASTWAYICMIALLAVIIITTII